MNQDTQNFSKEEVSIKELFFIVKSNIKKMYYSIAVCLILALIYLVAVRPVYKTSSSIIIEDENSTMSSIFDMGMASDMNYLENEIEVLKSRTTSERAIKSLLNSSYKNNLHLFNTKDFDDNFLKKTFRSIFLLNWNEKIINNIDEVINDS